MILNTNNIETLLVAMLPIGLKAADAVPWVIIISGSVTTIWVLYQLIKSIILDTKKKKGKK